MAGIRSEYDGAVTANPRTFHDSHRSNVKNCEKCSRFSHINASLRVCGESIELFHFFYENVLAIQREDFIKRSCSGRDISDVYSFGQRGKVREERFRTMAKLGPNLGRISHLGSIPGAGGDWLGNGAE